MSRYPFLSASVNAVSPVQRCCPSRVAPHLSISRTLSVSPDEAASMIGVEPSFATALISAPCRMSSLADVECILITANINAVRPFLSRLFGFCPLLSISSSAGTLPSSAARINSVCADNSLTLSLLAPFISVLLGLSNSTGQLHFHRPSISQKKYVNRIDQCVL